MIARARREPPRINYCKVCGIPTTKYCKQCKSVYYCNETCQRKDWKEHKPYCLCIYRLMYKIELPRYNPVIEYMEPFGISMFRDIYRSDIYSNIRMHELAHTYGGNENRNIVCVNGSSLRVFNTDSNTSNMVKPSDVIGFYNFHGAYDCFAVKFWKKGDENYDEYINKIKQKTSYKPYGIVGERREFDIMLNWIKQTCVIVIVKRIYNGDVDKMELFKKIMGRFSKSIIDDVITHIPIILEKKWAITIDWNDYDHGHIIFDPSTVLKTGKMIILYHTLEFSRRYLSADDAGGGC